MARIVVSEAVDASPEEVWAEMSDLGSHVEWMKDARSIVFVTEQRSGVGTRMEVETRVGPLRTLDSMEVTGWDEGRSIEVAHQGMVTGTGTLKASPEPGGRTRVSWEEHLVFPWWLGGRITAWCAKPILAAIWRGNLRRLAEMLSA